MDNIQALEQPPAAAPPASALVCDQAIFTSVPSPMGEGYRIIAASKGVRSEEKQAITRLSPSHDSVCEAAKESTGPSAAFGNVKAVARYPLPTGRQCLAISGFAGNEHTGRGGHRVYTLNLLMPPDAVQAYEFNPFNLIRALLATEQFEILLKPTAVMPPIELHPNHAIRSGLQNQASGLETLSPDARREILHFCFGVRRCIVPLDNNWLSSAEAILLGIPAPLREQLSFAAGLKFSLIRNHHLLLLSLDANTRARVASAQVKCIDRNTKGTAASTPWFDFVERHWSNSDLATLARRTSRHFTDCSADTLDRIAGFYDQIDALPGAPFEKLLTPAFTAPSDCSDAIERETREELFTSAQAQLLERIPRLDAHQAESLWARTLITLGPNLRSSPFAKTVVGPLLKCFAADPVKAVLRSCDALRASGGSVEIPSRLQEQLLRDLRAHLQNSPADVQSTLASTLSAASATLTHPLAESVRRTLAELMPPPAAAA